MSHSKAQLGTNDEGSDWGGEERGPGNETRKFVVDKDYAFKEEKITICTETGRHRIPCEGNFKILGLLF